MALIIFSPLLEVNEKSFVIEILRAICAITALVSFFGSAWFLLKAKGRSGLWMFTLIFSIVGIIIISLLKDYTTNTNSIRSNEAEDNAIACSTGEALMSSKVVAMSDANSNISIVNQAKWKLMLGRLLDLLCFVVAPAIVVVNWLSIRKKYDNSDYIFWIGVGVGFIAFGLLRKYWSYQGGKK